MNLQQEGRKNLLVSTCMRVCVCVCVTIRGVDTEVDGDGRDALVRPSDPVGFCFNLQTDLLKVHKFTALTVQELCILYMEKYVVYKRDGKN